MKFKKNWENGQRINIKKKLFKFEDTKFTRRFQKAFSKRHALRLHEDFELCTFLVIVICYRFRYIHPIHITELFGRSTNETDEFISKLIRRNYLKIDHLPGLGVGMTNQGHGYYLYSVSDVAKKKYLENCPYLASGKKVSRKFSAKSIHDLIPLRLSIIVAGKVNAIDIMPDYATGLTYEKSEKIPDIILKTNEGKAIWIELEYTPKSGNEMKDFCRKTIRSRILKRMSYSYIFFDSESDANRYKSELDIYRNIYGIRLVDDIKIFHTKAISYIDAYGGEIMNTDIHRPHNYRKDHIPHGLEEQFNQRRRGPHKKAFMPSDIRDLQEV